MLVMIFLIPFFVFMIAFLIHKYLVIPLEVLVFSPEIAEHASLLYLPHAVRIVSYYILGPISLVPIFFSQCITFILFNDAELLNTISLSTISTLSIYLGFYLYEIIKKDNLFNIIKTVDWKKIIIIGFLVSIFNSTLSSLYLNILFKKSYEYINLNYLIGDVLGLIFGMILFIFSIKFYFYWGNKIGNQN